MSRQHFRGYDYYRFTRLGSEQVADASTTKDNRGIDVCCGVPVSIPYLYSHLVDKILIRIIVSLSSPLLGLLSSGITAGAITRLLDFIHLFIGLSSNARFPFCVPVYLLQERSLPAGSPLYWVAPHVERTAGPTDPQRQNIEATERTVVRTAP